MTTNQYKRKANESFVRWQGRTIEEFGKAINLLLGLCLATIGFIVSKLLDKDFYFSNCTARIVVFIGGVALLIATISLLLLIWNRLYDFRETAQIAHKRETNERTGIEALRAKVNKRGKCTWTLFKLSVVAFSIGELFVIIGFAFEIICP